MRTPMIGEAAHHNSVSSWALKDMTRSHWEKGVESLLSRKNQFHGRGPERWCNVPVFCRLGTSPAGRAPTLLNRIVGARPAGDCGLSQLDTSCRYQF